MCSIIGVGEKLHKVLGQVDLGTLDSGERSLPFGLLVIVLVLVRVRILFISSLGPDFIYLESRSGFYRCSPGPDCINDQSESRSRSGFYPLRVWILYWSSSGCYPFLSPGPSPEFIKQVRVLVRVQLRILSVSSPGPDFIKHVRVRVHVRILTACGLEAILVMCG